MGRGRERRSRRPPHHTGGTSRLAELGARAGLSLAVQEYQGRHDRHRTGVEAIKQDTSQISQIMEELNRLRDVIATGNPQRSRQTIILSSIDILLISQQMPKRCAGRVSLNSDNNSIHVISQASSPKAVPEAPTWRPWWSREATNPGYLLSPFARFEAASIGIRGLDHRVLGHGYVAAATEAKGHRKTVGRARLLARLQNMLASGGQDQDDPHLEYGHLADAADAHRSSKVG